MEITKAEKITSVVLYVFAIGVLIGGMFFYGRRVDKHMENLTPEELIRMNHEYHNNRSG